ncbi:MAG: AMP-binding protein [Thaumarchaeota archaeon]|nr:AMP-binding protein [Nitrososphaerota archaeon]
MSDASYKMMRAEFQWSVPEYFNWASNVFDAYSNDPSKVALHWVDDQGTERKATFTDLTNRSKRFAAVLQSLGIGKGDRIYVMLPNIPEWWELALGCIRLGAVLMPATTMLTPKDIKYRLAESSATVVVTDTEGAVKVDEVRGDAATVKEWILLDGDRAGWRSYTALMTKPLEMKPVEKTRSSDPMLIYFTSGTVGYPKMVLHTQASYGIGHTTTSMWLNLRSGDVHWTITGTGWAKHAFGNLFGPWNVGACIFIYYYEDRFDPKAHLDVLQKHHITSFCAPPTAWRRIVLEDLSKYRFPHLRETMSAGEPLNPEVIEKWKQSTHLTIRDGYGQTEVTIVVANFPGVKVKSGSMGLPAPGFDVAVVDDAGKELPSASEGELAVRVKPNRPVGLFQEYVKDPERTKKCFVGDWYLTGDTVYRDQDGYYWFIGRKDDIIKSSGYRIGPFEVESALMEHPAVAEAAAVASPDDLLGSAVKAFIVLKEGYSRSKDLENELIEFTKKITAPYKHPRRIEFVSDLPKTITGKIRRNELRALELEKHRAEKSKQSE